MRKIIDTEGVTHFAGPALAVNVALCGNNDPTENEPGAHVDCRACVAVVEYVKSNGRKG